MLLCIQPKILEVKTKKIKCVPILIGCGDALFALVSTHIILLGSVATMIAVIQGYIQLKLCMLVFLFCFSLNFDTALKSS